MKQRQSFGTTLLVFAVKFDLVFHQSVMTATLPAALTFNSLLILASRELRQLIDDRHIWVLRLKDDMIARGHDTTTRHGPTLWSVLPGLVRWCLSDVLLRAGCRQAGLLTGLYLHIATVYAYYFLHTLAGGLHDIVEATKHSHQERFLCFRDIMEHSRPEVTFWELLIWLLTKPRHIASILDDYREESANYLARHPGATALPYYRRRCLVDIWGRLKATMVMMLMRAFLHHLANVFRHHR